jgi:hypothetical protein
MKLLISELRNESIIFEFTFLDNLSQFHISPLLHQKPQHANIKENLLPNPRLTMALPYLAPLVTPLQVPKTKA